jgi:hypothetical protein
MPECDFDFEHRFCFRKPTDTHIGVEMPREHWCPDEFEWNGYELKEGSDDACFRYVSCDEV